MFSPLIRSLVACNMWRSRIQDKRQEKDVASSIAVLLLEPPPVDKRANHKRFQKKMYLLPQSLPCRCDLPAVVGAR